MCLAVPGKIIKIEKDIATVDYIAEKRKARLVKKFRINDYVIVQGGVVLMKIPKKQAIESLKAFASTMDPSKNN